ncbi:MAG: DUF2892 domain-containing protein [Alphaproteobacteria bacterium]|nr:DUF2892 domain-containing protein [Alphaproteobacteria bacterium]
MDNPNGGHGIVHSRRNRLLRPYAGHGARAEEKMKRKRANRMRQNMGSMDRIARAILGLLLLAYAL